MFKNPLVVGYKGEIGAFILQGLLKVMPKALNVWCFDINESEEEKIERIKKVDYIFLCVPINETLSWILKYKQYLKDKIIVEQCSLKHIIFKQMKQKGIEDLKFISMHILFRPSVTPSTVDRRCAILMEPLDRVLGQDMHYFIETIRSMTNSEIVYYDNYEEHDEAMALQQALVHRVILTLGQLIKQSNGKTYVSGKILELYDRIKKGDKVLYETIQKNGHTKEALNKFKQLLQAFEVREYIGK